VPRAHSVLAVTGTLFVTLAATVVLFGAPPADSALRNAVLSLASPAVVGVMHVVNYAGYWKILLPGTVLLLLVFPRARREWWLWCGLMMVAPLTEWALKQVVRRPRPESAAFAFPSGHATAAAAFFGAAIYLAGSLPGRARAVVRAVAILGIVLVGLARIVLRAHWPSDVLAGIALGLALASLAAVIAAADSPRDR
jgi:membrane-associated phospholipid phosphatase